MNKKQTIRADASEGGHATRSLDAARSRRGFLRRLGAGAAAALAAPSAATITRAASAAEAAPAMTGRKPNIIFILADDLGYGDVGCFGQTKIRTPSLDRMAAEGARLTDFYSGSAECMPARCSLMTGLHTGHTWIRSNGGKPLRPEDRTVAELLKQAGYATGVIGKWGLGSPGSTGEPNAKGFDYWFGYLSQTLAHNFYPDSLYKNGAVYPLPGNADGAKGQYSHDLFTQEALEFVERSREQPFFLYLAYTIPHATIEVPEDSLAEYRGQFPEKPYVANKTGAGAYASQPTPNAAFAAMVTRLDRDIGRLLDRLREFGIDRDTFVMFSSDNGPHKEGGADPRFFGSSGPLRGIKRDVYEGGIRVPTIARWPGRVAAGSVCARPAAFWDFLPTALELAGAPALAPPGIDGVSFLPALLGKPQPERAHLYWKLREREAVRAGKWKAVRMGANKPIELYDLDADIGEQHNVAGEHPEVASRLEAMMRQAYTPPPAEAERRSAPKTRSGQPARQSRSGA